MTDNPFAAPASASGIDWSELAGRLLVIEPHAVEPNVQTSLGTKDAVRADVHVIDQEVADTYDDALIFPRVLISQLRSKVGQMVLGRLEQGVAKPGQSAPWRLAEATTQDQALAGAWLRKRQTNTFTAPGQGQAGGPPYQGQPAAANAAPPF